MRWIDAMLSSWSPSVTPNPDLTAQGWGVGGRRCSVEGEGGGESGRIQKTTPPKGVRIHPVSNQPWKLKRVENDVFDGEDAV